MIRFIFPQINYRMIADSKHLPEAITQIAQLLRWAGISNPGPVEIYQTVYKGILREEVKIAG